MYDKTLVKDNFGKQYSFQTRINPRLGSKLKPKEFPDMHMTRSFLQRLVVPPGFWQSLIDDASSISQPLFRQDDLESAISERIINGQLKVFEVSPASTAPSSPEKRKIQGGENIFFFLTATEVLLDKAEVIHFSDADAARAFLQSLNPSEEQLRGIATGLNLPVAANTSATEVSQCIADAMAKGDASLMREMKTSATPPTEVEKAMVVATQSTGLGSEENSDNSTTTKQTECSCSITNFTAEEGQRKNNKENVLQIVPKPSKTESVAYELMGIKLSIKEEYAGKSKVRYSMGLLDRKTEDCYKIIRNGETITKNSTVIEEKGVDNPSDSKWLINASPDILSVEGHGCDKVKKSIVIEKYPNNYHSVEGNLDVFGEWVEQVNKAWDDWGKKFFSISPVELNPKLTGPAGTFSANWGWKEDSDWRAFYHVSLKFGLDPILGVEISLSLSMLKLVGTLAGIPPAASKLLSEHLLDIIFSLGGDCKGMISGEPQGKFYADGTDLLDGEAKFGIDGGVTASIKGRLGSKYIVSASLRGAATAKIKGEDAVDVNRDGVFLQTKINLSPFVGTFTVTYKYFNMRTKTNTSKWEPWQEIKLYESEKKKLLPR